MNKLICLISLCFFSFNVSAQEAEKSIEVDSAASSAAEEIAPASSDKKASDKKMIRAANINLQTTVTGNQEQPRVMYILPWQSPLSPDLEMEMLSSQEDAVFGHVERDEMQRSLEAAGELDLAE